MNVQLKKRLIGIGVGDYLASITAIAAERGRLSEDMVVDGFKNNRGGIPPPTTIYRYIINSCINRHRAIEGGTNIQCISPCIRRSRLKSYLIKELKLNDNEYDNEKKRLYDYVLQGIGSGAYKTIVHSVPPAAGCDVTAAESAE